MFPSSEISSRGPRREGGKSTFYYWVWSGVRFSFSRAWDKNQSREIYITWLLSQIPSSWVNHNSARGMAGRKLLAGGNQHLILPPTCHLGLSRIRTKAKLDEWNHVRWLGVDSWNENPPKASPCYLYSIPMNLSMLPTWVTGKNGTNDHPGSPHFPPLTQRLAINLLRKPLPSQQSTARECGLGDSPQRSLRGPFQWLRVSYPEAPVGDASLRCCKEWPPDRSSLGEKERLNPHGSAPEWNLQTHKAIQIKDGARVRAEYRTHQLDGTFRWSIGRQMWNIGKKTLHLVLIRALKGHL